MIELTIPGQPIAKQSAKFREAHTKQGHKFMMSYTPKKIVNHTVFIKELFAIKYPKFKPIEGAVGINIYAYVMIPISTSKKRKLLMAAGKIFATKKPDEDNIKKTIYDALEKLAYNNDSQIVRSSFSKMYSESPRTEIIISEITTNAQVVISEII